MLLSVEMLCKGIMQAEKNRPVWKWYTPYVSSLPAENHFRCPEADCQSGNYS